MLISLEEAIFQLKQGNVVGVPTETVYGLAASLAFPQAIENIFKLKGRPSNNPLIIHVASLDQINAFVETLTDGFLKLSETFWPGPMTLVVPIIESTIPNLARSNLPTAAFRIPNHPLTLQLLHETGPLVMPSANLSGTPSATSSTHVLNDFGIDFPVLDGAICKCGLESTILIFLENRWQIIRLGSLPPLTFESVLGYVPSIQEVKNGSKPICPGQMYKHYAPKAKLTLSEIPSNEIEGIILGFSDRIYNKASQFFPLGSSTNPEEVAENLYAALRSLDLMHIEKASVDVNFPQNGLWLTIHERLLKASKG